MRQKPVCQETVRWLRAKHGKNCFAPFTGQDWSVFGAYCHLLEAWFRSGYQDRLHMIVAMREMLLACQPCVRAFAKDAIIAIGDYGFVDEIWPKICPKEI